ncbi:UDP-N-acetylmuramoyl-L-alanine--D-glutamate ligase [Elusimicrobiota bacterium]
MGTFDYAVLGLGKTGQAVIKYLAEHEPAASILGSDSKHDPKLLASLKKLYPQVQFETGGHSDRVLGSKCAIKSPGIHPDSEILKSCKERRMPVLSEIDFAFLNIARPEKVIAITGTNGKTTTTHMLGSLLKQAGKRVIVAGNIGEPLILYSDKITPKSILVLELSSYQLEDSRSLGLDCAIMLNITKDHLDHHRDFKTYQQAKKKIISFLAPNGTLIANLDDKMIRRFADKASQNILFFSKKKTHHASCWLKNNSIMIKNKKGVSRVRASKHLLGDHNMENQMAVLLAASYLDVPSKKLLHALTDYKAPAHRLEIFGEKNKVLFINDSKATNVDATVTALKAITPLACKRAGKILLLLGGRGKGEPYKSIKKFKGIIRSLYIYGEDTIKIKNDLSGLNHSAFADIRTSARNAIMEAKQNDIIILSPACASFDQFSDFEKRGEEFRKIWQKSG